MEEKELVQQLSLPIYQSKGWLKLLGVMSFLQGLISIISIFGIIICWLPIWIGILLFKAANAIEVAQVNGDSRQFTEALNKLKMYFIINGVLIIVGFAIGAILFLVSGASIMALMGDI